MLELASTIWDWFKKYSFVWQETVKKCDFLFSDEESVFKPHHQFPWSIILFNELWKFVPGRSRMGRLSSSQSQNQSRTSSSNQRSSQGKCSCSRQVDRHSALLRRSKQVGHESGRKNNRTIVVLIKHVTQFWSGGTLPYNHKYEIYVSKQYSNINKMPKRQTLVLPLIYPFWRSVVNPLYAYFCYFFTLLTVVCLFSPLFFFLRLFRSSFRQFYHRSRGLFDWVINFERWKLASLDNFLYRIIQNLYLPCMYLWSAVAQW